MAHRSPKHGSPGRSTSRGNSRTRSGAGRHNLPRGGPKNPPARIRICLSCDRPFKSRGPWNRICGRCREQHTEIETTRAYHIPAELRS